MDAAAIKKQLNELVEERRQVDKRLNRADWRNRHQGGPPDDARPPPGPSLFDRIVRVGDHSTKDTYINHNYLGDNPRREFFSGPSFERDARNDEGFPPQVGQKRRLQSAVLVDGETRLVATPEERRQQQQEEGELRASKRPTPSDRDSGDGNPALRKRNARMFGALMGTLRKFKDDELQRKDSKAQQLRQEALQRAKAKAKEQTAELRQRERQQQLQARQADMDKRRHLNFDTEIKRVELLYACRVGVEVKASQWLKTTSAGPAVLWIPAVHDAKTHRMLEERHSEFEAWKERHMKTLEEEIQKLRQQHEEIDARIMQRRAEAAATAEAKRAAGEEGDEDEERAMAEAEREGAGEHADTPHAADAPDDKGQQQQQEMEDKKEEDGENTDQQAEDSQESGREVEGRTEKKEGGDEKQEDARHEDRYEGRAEDEIEFE